LKISTIETIFRPHIALRIEYSPGIRGGISEFLQKFSRFSIVLQGLGKNGQLGRSIGKICISDPKFRRKIFAENFAFLRPIFVNNPSHNTL